MRGAPIRFVAVVIGGWTCIRIAVLLPGDGPLDLAADVLAPPALATGRADVRRADRPAPFLAASSPVPDSPRRSFTEDRGAPTRVAVGRSSQRAADLPPKPAATQVDEAPAVLIPATLGPERSRTAAQRLGGGAWLLARGGASGTLSGGMLGGSQAGARLTYTVDARRGVMLSARVAAPLRGKGAEIAAGMDWRPTRAPLHLLVEQRFGLDGARGGPTVMAIAGVKPAPVAAGFRLEAYAQGGAIWRDGRAETFGDGSARLTRPVLQIGGATLDAGAGTWAAGQRGAARVDIGPTIGVALPLARRRIRVSADWRQRVAGNARPGSGPALSIGTDF